VSTQKIDGLGSQRAGGSNLTQKNETRKTKEEGETVRDGKNWDWVGVGGGKSTTQRWGRTTDSGPPCRMRQREHWT